MGVVWPVRGRNMDIDDSISRTITIDPRLLSRCPEQTLQNYETIIPHADRRGRGRFLARFPQYPRSMFWGVKIPAARLGARRLRRRSGQRARFRDRMDNDRRRRWPVRGSLSVCSSPAIPQPAHCRLRRLMTAPQYREAVLLLPPQPQADIPPATRERPLKRQCANRNISFSTIFAAPTCFGYLYRVPQNQGMKIRWFRKCANTHDNNNLYESGRITVLNCLSIGELCRTNPGYALLRLFTSSYCAAAPSRRRRGFHSECVLAIGSRLSASIACWGPRHG